MFALQKHKRLNTKYEWVINIVEMLRRKDIIHENLQTREHLY